jgi:hypothetical protein
MGGTGTSCMHVDVLLNCPKEIWVALGKSNHDQIISSRTAAEGRGIRGKGSSGRMRGALVWAWRAAREQEPLKRRRPNKKQTEKGKGPKDGRMPKPMKKAGINGLGPCRQPKWIGLILDYDGLSSSKFCHVRLATQDLMCHG